MSTLLSTSFRLLFNRFVISPSLKKQTHCLQLEENSSDVAQWEELIVNLEAALRSIGHLVIDDSESDLHSADDGAPLNNDGDNEDEETAVR